MATTIDARNVHGIKDRCILFDTNIWLILEGPSYGPSDDRQVVYSNAYGILLKTNIILVHQYVISEFCNRYLKIEYGSHKEASGEGDRFPSLKKFKQTDDGKLIIESARDTCIGFLKDCEFVSANCEKLHVEQALDSFGAGQYDFTDALLRDHAVRSEFTIMTDDADFLDCGVDLITGNKRLIRLSKHK